MSQKFCNILVHASLQHVYHVIEPDPAVIGSNWCADMFCITSICDLKAVQVNIQCSLIWELMLYKFELNHNTAEATKNICCTTGEDAVDHRKKKVGDLSREQPKGSLFISYYTEV